MGLFDELYPEVDGAMQASNMRFLLSIPKGEGKRLTKRGVVVLICVSALVLALVLAGATWLGAEETRFLHQHMEPLLSAVGEPKTAVFELLAAEGDGLVEVAPDVYVIPGGCRMGGTEFAVTLRFDAHEGLLDGFAYATQIKAEPQEAAKVLETFLEEYYKATITLEAGQEVALNRKALTQILSGESEFVFQDSADVTPQREGVSAVAAYLRYLENAEYWEGRLREYLIKRANFYRDIYVTYTPGTQTLNLKVSFQVAADRD